MSLMYLHIPFCGAKCAYCDFYSRPASAKFTHERYVDALIREFELRKNETGESFSTIYFGGGTPSSVPANLLKKVVNRLTASGLFEDVKEFTIEVNPEDVTAELLNEYKELGVGRISMGIQTFNDEILRIIGRRNSSDNARKALRLLNDYDFEFSGDVIYGLPGQTTDIFKTDLQEMLGYGPNHFSAYLLSYEPGTRLTAMKNRGLVREAPEETVEEMYSTLCDLSRKNGFDHYEISNFSKPCKRAIHNSGYWANEKYVGLGVSAYSFDGKKRRYNPADLKTYLERVESGRVAFEIEEESFFDCLNNKIITGLRTSNGLNLLEIPLKERKELLKSAAPMIENNSIVLNDNILVIPEQKWLIADNIMRELLFV